MTDGIDGEGLTLSADPDEVRAAARSVLEANWRPEGYTVPNASVYPFQWLWDSCFHAITWADLGEPDRARSELAHLFRTQNSEGFVPHDIPQSRNRRCSVMQLPNSSVGELMSAILLSRRRPDSTFSLRSGRVLMGLLLFVIRGKAVVMIVRVGTTGAPVVGMWMFGARSKERLLRRSNIQQSGPR
ncbi:MAG: hypothetical protein EBR99_05520 [Actinobacteria bacterium]|nr:hypothetical protein [Actinomycetota bacterium]